MLFNIFKWNEISRISYRGMFSIFEHQFEVRLSVGAGVQNKRLSQSHFPPSNVCLVPAYFSCSLSIAVLSELNSLFSLSASKDRSKSYKKKVQLVMLSIPAVPTLPLPWTTMGHLFPVVSPTAGYLTGW